ncbi:MAG TPA: hypothetical protein VFB63_06010 [Bryobacteraceae bacterium]|nr:hypothetical protein [Bryobacteraceae bacterium]
MGFALWTDHDTAWAAGTHEYRPMGVAVIAGSNLFTARDFRAARTLPARTGPNFRGLFASLSDVNRYLVQSRSQASKKNLRRGSSRQLAIT